MHIPALTSGILRQDFAVEKNEIVRHGDNQKHRPTMSASKDTIVPNLSAEALNGGAGRRYHH